MVYCLCIQLKPSSADLCRGNGILRCTQQNGFYHSERTSILYSLYIRRFDLLEILLFMRSGKRDFLFLMVTDSRIS